MPKILFIQPTQYGVGRKPCKQARIHLPGLVFPLLAAMTPKRWEVEARLEVVDDIDFETDADLVGIGAMGHTIFRAMEIAREFRRRGKQVVLGGYMASLAVEEARKHADSVVVGDAELSYPLMLRDFEKYGSLKPVYNHPITTLNNLPVPRYELLLEKSIGNMLPVQAGRGCPYTCSFCSIACLYKGRYLCRPIDEVVRDIRAVKDLGFRRFYLLDDNISSNPLYLEALCKEIEPLKMTWTSQCSLVLARNRTLLDVVRRSGADLMSFGVESISQEGLDKLGKSWLRVDEHESMISALTKAGIMVSSEMILGTDSDTEESIRATYEFVQRTRIPIPRFYILTPIPGTELFKQYQVAGRLTTENFELYDGTTCVHLPQKISAHKLTELYWWLNRKVFSIPSIVYRTLLHPAAWKHPLRYLFAFVVNLHYRAYIRKGVPPNIY